MIIEPEDLARLEAEGGVGGSQVSRRERATRLGQVGSVLWLDGAVEDAYALERRLWDRGWTGFVLEDGETAKALADAGLLAIVASDASAPDGALSVSIDGEGERAVDALVSSLVDQGVLIDRR